MPGLLSDLFQGGILSGLLGPSNRMGFDKAAHPFANRRPVADTPRPEIPPGFRTLQAQPGGVPANPMPGPSFLNTLGDRLNSPLTQMSLQLLASSQPSTTPQNLGETLGQAALGLSAARREDELLALLERLRRD